MTQEAPAYISHVFGNPEPANPEGKPYWSGAGAPPAIGSTIVCADKKRTEVKITGYSIDRGWLMAEGFRVAEPTIAGNLAGREILYEDAAAVAAQAE